MGSLFARYWVALKKRCSCTLLWAAAFLGITSCSNSECYDNHSALPLAAFYSYDTQAAVSMQQLDIFGIGAPGDSILYSKENLTEAYLPFRLGADTTRYVFRYNALAPAPDDDQEEEESKYIPQDTVTFIYKSHPWFVSPACGAMYFFDVDTVKYTGVLIDSIYCEPQITNVNSANIKIFFKTIIDE